MSPSRAGRQLVQGAVSQRPFVTAEIPQHCGGSALIEPEHDGGRPFGGGESLVEQPQLRAAMFTAMRDPPVSGLRWRDASAVSFAQHLGVDACVYVGDLDGDLVDANEPPATRVDNVMTSSN